MFLFFKGFDQIMLVKFFCLTKWLKMFLSLLVFAAVIKGINCDLKDRAPYDYCDPNLKLCDEPSAHTMCRYPIPGLSDDCAPFMNEPLSGDEKLHLLSLHNKLRNRVANGSEKVNSDYLPPASNMVQMHWDVELETIAARWVERCWDVTFPKIHDDCRNIIRFNVTQNVGTMGSKGFVTEKQVNRIFMGWYKKNQSFIPKYIDANNGSIEVKRAEDYINLIWADTYAIGCSRVLFQKNISANQGKEGLTPWTFERIVCNYGPGGNIPGKAIYKRGTPCSNCPEGMHCGKEYPSLCTFDDFEKKTDTTLKMADKVDAELLTQLLLTNNDSISKGASHPNTVAYEDLAEPYKNLTEMSESPLLNTRKTIANSRKPNVLLRAGIYFNGVCHCPDITRSGPSMKTHFNPRKLEIKKIRFLLRHFGKLEGTELGRVQAGPRQGDRCYCKIKSEGIKAGVSSEFLFLIPFFYIIQLINYLR